MEKVGEGGSPEFKWLAKRGVGGKRKEIQFYESFMYDGVKYAIYDTVYLYKEGLTEPYIGKLVKIWEHKDKSRKVKVQWFFRQEEILKWLRDTETLENEIFLASGDGTATGLANVNPLEAIAGHCNVVCVSKDFRNRQPSDEELKAADYVFYRTFDVQSCTISEKMGDTVGVLEIKFILNSKDTESASTGPKLKSDKEVENTTTTTSEPQQNLVKSPSVKPIAIKSDEKNAQLTVKIDGKGELLVEGAQGRKSVSAVEPSSGAPIDSCKGETSAKLGKRTDQGNVICDKDKMKMSEIGVNNDKGEEIKGTPAVSKKSKGRSSNTDGTDKGERKMIEVPVSNVDVKVKKESTISNKLPDRPSEKNKSNCSIRPPQDKQVEVKDSKRPAVDSDRSNDMLSKKAKVDDSSKLPVDNQLKRKEKLASGNDNVKALLNSGASEVKPNLENGKAVVGPDTKMKSATIDQDSDGRILKKARIGASLKVSDNKNSNAVEKLSTNINLKDDKNLMTTSVSFEEKAKPTVAMNSAEMNKKPSREHPGTGKRNLSMCNSLKVPTSSSDEDMKSSYKEFVVSPKPNADKSNWFRKLPWEERLRRAYDQGTVVLLLNLDPEYTSGEVEDILWHALKENCEAKMIPHTAVSSPDCGQALVLFKTRETTDRVLEKLDKECLILSNGRPLVGITCPPISLRENSKFFGHFAIDKNKLQNQRDMDEAVSTSHFSQPNTIEYDMAMEWCLQQERSEKCWKAVNKQQGQDLRKLEANLKQK